LRPVFHHSENNVVYNDFGADLLDLLDELGFVTDPMLFASSVEVTSHHVTSAPPVPCRASNGTAAPARQRGSAPEIDLRAGPAPDPRDARRRGRNPADLHIYRWAVQD